MLHTAIVRLPTEEKHHAEGCMHSMQAGVIPAILAGRDVIGIAQTGSGKTAAFALPILYQLSRERYGVFALALTPTRCALLFSHLFRMGRPS